MHHLIYNCSVITLSEKWCDILQKLLDYDIDRFLGYLIFPLRENDIDVLFSFKLRQTFTKE